MSYRKLATHPLHSLLRSTLTRTAAGALGAAAPLMALANPTGGQVVAGNASIGSAGANGVVVNQGSQRAIINWQQFSVGSGQYVQFVQPNSSSVVLNRVTGSNPSNIFGQILANGQVFLVNPNGVYFAPGASIDVQGLVASTLDLSDKDFMLGRYVFSKAPGAPDAGVVNGGSIQISKGGYVVLAGDYAQNDGTITAQTGRVVLAAGSAATLMLDNNQLLSYVVDGKTLSRLAGVANTGDITANGGMVVMTADVANALTATAVNNSGLITAHSVSEHGGEIVLLADSGIENSGTLDASATDTGVKGGTVILHATGGDTKLTPDSVINVFGNGADGGFIDVSGHEITIKGQIEGGKGARLLLDPSVIRIEASNGTSHSSNCSGCEGGVIHTNFIEHELKAGLDLTIVASNSIVNSGATAITALTGSGKLSLKIGTTSFNTVSGGTLHRITSSIFNNAASSQFYKFNPVSGGTINITGIVINIKGGFVASASVGTVLLDNVTAGSILVSGKNINTRVLHATGPAASGNVTLVGAESVPAFSGGNITVTGAITADHGSVSITGTGGGDSSGANITVTGPITAAKAVNITAQYIGSSSNGGGKIKLGNVKGSGVIISAFGGHPSISVGNVTATVSSASLKASGGGAQPTTVKTGNVSGRNVDITARGNGASINVAGTLDASGTNGVTLQAFNLKSSSGISKVKVSGAITSGKSVSVTAFGHGAQISVGQITANTVGCLGTACTSAHVLISASHGVVKATGDITLDKDNFKPGRVVIDGRSLQVGNITALGGRVSISADTFSSVNPAGITQASGKTITARDINIDLNASYGGNITLSNLTASSSKGSAGITIAAHSANGGNNNITVNGDINVSGKAGNAGIGFSSGMPGVGVPVGASLDISATGLSTTTHTIQINGNVNVTAHAGAFNGNNTCSCESGPSVHIHEHGTGGAAVVNIFAQGSGGSAQVTGATTVKGTDAEVIVGAKHIKMGALTVTGSGHTTSITASSTGSTPFSGSSKNSLGRAVVHLGGSSGAAATIATGNIVVSGKGSATVDMEGRNVTAGDITVSATAAKGSRSGQLSASGVNDFLPGILGVPLDHGSYNAGRAGVFIGSSHGSPHSQPTPGQSIKVGNVTVKGVGEADIELAATNIQTKALTVSATKGTIVGTGTSGSGGITDVHKFNINGGEAHVGLDTGYGSNTVINVAGAITVTGPVAGVDLHADTIKVSGAIAVTGSGGLITSDQVVTGASNYHLHYVGPGNVTGVNIGGATSTASVNIGGTVSVKGSGLVGVLITGGKVTLGGLSASASAARNYSVLDTRVSATADNFTLGSVVAIVLDASGSTFKPATINGNVTIKAAHGSVFLPDQWNVSGQVKVTASGNITTDASTISGRFSEAGDVGNHNGKSSSGGIPSGLPFSIKAAGLTMVAGGSIDLTGATANVSGIMQLVADKDIILSGVTLNVGTFIADASGTIHNGGAIGTINAGALAIVAGKDINLSSTDITVGSGTVSSIAGDATLMQGLLNAGLEPASTNPNATFIAGGNLSLGSFTLKGSYLYLQGKNITITGPVTTNKGTVVQISPIDPTATVGVEDQPGTGAGFNISNSLLLSLFPSDTLVLGNGAQTGDITLGNNGSIDIGDSNLIIDTSGTVTGLENVISTGLISTLESLLGSAVVPPTPSEIDPNSNNNNNAAGGKHHELGSEDVTPNGTGGTISQDTGGGVCH